jgi:hypothetical protein
METLIFVCSSVKGEYSLGLRIQIILEAGSGSALGKKLDSDHDPHISQNSGFLEAQIKSGSALT